MRSHRRHFHRGLHDVDRRIDRRGALSRVQDRRQHLGDCGARGADRHGALQQRSATACAIAAISATRSPICRAAPPTCRARWPRCRAACNAVETQGSRRRPTGARRRRSDCRRDRRTRRAGEARSPKRCRRTPRCFRSTARCRASGRQRAGAPACAPGRKRSRAWRKRSSRRAVPRIVARSYRGLAFEGGHRQPHRPVSAADRDVAAAQGAVLRGGVAPAHRERRHHSGRRFRRCRRERRPDAEDRQSCGVPLRAGGAPLAVEKPRRRVVLQSQCRRRSPTR